MSEYACIIQEGQSAHERRDTLEEGLRRIGQESFGDAGCSIEEIIVTAWDGPLSI